MSKYRVVLTILETGPLSKEDFRKLQEAVDAIAGITEFRMILDPVTPRDITGHDLPEDEKALTSHK